MGPAGWEDGVLLSPGDRHSRGRQPGTPTLTDRPRDGHTGLPAGAAAPFLQTEALPCWGGVVQLCCMCTCKCTRVCFCMNVGVFAFVVCNCICTCVLVGACVCTHTCEFVFICMCTVCARFMGLCVPVFGVGRRVVY